MDWKFWTWLPRLRKAEKTLQLTEVELAGLLRQKIDILDQCVSALDRLSMCRALAIDVGIAHSILSNVAAKYRGSVREPAEWCHRDKFLHDLVEAADNLSAEDASVVWCVARRLGWRLSKAGNPLVATN